MMATACENPFRVQCMHGLGYRLAGENWEDLLSRLAALNYRAAVVGPHGHGKSTFLRALAPRLEDQGFRVRPLLLNEAHPTIDPGELRELSCGLGSRDIVFLDGCEQLGPWAWRRFRYCTRNAGGLVVTTHSPGRLPALLECRSTPELLETLLRELDPDPRFCEPRLPARLFKKHAGNLRAVFFDLYDRAATGD